MIDTIRSYSHHTLFGIVAEGVPSVLHSLKSVVNRIATSILINLVISVTLFYFHHNLFSLGFVVGFIFDKKVRQVVEKVNIVYNAHKTTYLESFYLLGGGGFLALLTMPTSMIFATLYYSSQWGAMLYRTSKHRLDEQAILAQQNVPVQPNIPVQQNLPPPLVIPRHENHAAIQVIEN